MQEPALPVEHESQAHTEADGAHGPVGGPIFSLSAEGWVYVGLTIFILLAIFVGKAPKRIAEALDQRIAETRRQLDEAKAIRAEAERLLNEAAERHRTAATEAEAIMKQAETEAANVIAQADKNAEALITRRSKMAEDKIAAEERRAITELRARAAELATAAATKLIAERHDAQADKSLIDKTIATLTRPH